MMWMNFKENEQKAMLPLSRQSSRSSRKSSSSPSHLQKKIEEFVFQNNTEEWKKEQEYKERRRKKKLAKKHIKAQMTMTHAKPLFIPASILMCTGIILTFGACIRSVSEGTFMWTHRETLRIVGPVTLGVGIVVLLVAVAVDGYIKEKVKTDNCASFKPLIHPDFHSDQFTISRKSSAVTYLDPEDSFRSLLKPDEARHDRKWYECTQFNSTTKSEDSLWSSSCTSNLTSQDSHQDSHMWNNSTVKITVTDCREQAHCDKCIQHSDVIDTSEEHTFSVRPKNIGSSFPVIDRELLANGAYNNADKSDMKLVNTDIHKTSDQLADVVTHSYTTNALINHTSTEKQYLENCIAKNVSVV